jgi:hypothetical protein
MTRRRVKESLISELRRRAADPACAADSGEFLTEAIELEQLEPGKTLPWWAMSRARLWGLM